MKINIPLVSNQLDGFGTTARQISKAFRDLGHEVIHDQALNDPVDVVLNFSHPHQWRYSDHALSIGYFPWESDAPRDGWKKHMSLVDDVWVPTPWLAKVSRSWGYPAYVFQHGVNPRFKSTSTSIDRPETLKFLHIGMEAHRKGGYEVLTAFRKAFGSDPRVHLTLKTKSKGMPGTPFPNISIVSDDLDLNELVQLYRDHDVFVLPSWGEGFGLPARDAIAMGMPTIHTKGFAPYQDYLDPDLLIESELVDSPWPEVHPGKMFKPDRESLVEVMDSAYSNFTAFKAEALAIAPKVHATYDWNTLASEAILRMRQQLALREQKQ